MSCLCDAGGGVRPAVCAGYERGLSRGGVVKFMKSREFGTNNLIL